MGQPLEDILAGKEPEADAEETVVEQKEEAQAPEEEKPQEDSTPEEETVEATEDTPEPEGVKEEAEPPAAKESKEVPLAALLDERDKRKELQSELEKLKSKAEEKKDLPDFWEDPKATLDAMREEFQRKLEKKEQAFAAQRLADSMTSAAYRHKDFEQYREAFAQAAEQNNALVDQALQAPDPGEYIYDIGRQFAQFDEVGGDIDSLRAKIRAEIMQELAEKDESKKTKLAAVPTPITDETNASAPQDKVEGGPTPLDNIFSNNRM